MAHVSFLHLSVRSWKFLIVTAILGAVFALLLSLVTPLEYSSSVRVLVIQPSATGFDPYTAIKSTERIAASLSELAYASTFFDNVMRQAQGFDASYFPSQENDKRKLWRKTLQMNVESGTGIMTITAYHPVREQARILADGVAKELALETPNFFGSNVRVQVIDSPLDSQWFTRPNFLLNGSFGAFVGLLVGFAWMLWKSVKMSGHAQG